MGESWGMSPALIPRRARLLAAPVPLGLYPSSKEEGTGKGTRAFVLHGSLRHALRDEMARVRGKRPRIPVSKDEGAHRIALSNIGPEGLPQFLI